MKIHGEPFVKLHRLGWRRTALRDIFQHGRCAYRAAEDVRTRAISDFTKCESFLVATERLHHDH